MITWEFDDEGYLHLTTEVESVLGKMKYILQLTHQEASELSYYLIDQCPLYEGKNQNLSNDLYVGVE